MAEDEDDKVQYQFKVERSLWENWKNTVPRSRKLDEKIIELLKEDLRMKTDSDR